MPDESQIEADSLRVLQFLGEQVATATGSREDRQLSSTDIQSGTTVELSRVNAAIRFLGTHGYVEFQTSATPDMLANVRLTPRGGIEYQRLATAPRTMSTSFQGASLARYPIPVGSPFGFTESDWEFVMRERRQHNKLKVVLGLQFESTCYVRTIVVENMRSDFLEAINRYNAIVGHTPIILDFRMLGAGYGEHLFNEISRDIISADIAVFETSDSNPNVMIEIGVALTWGTRVLPIKIQGRERPPSDISGQTWADYTDNCANFVDPDHERKLDIMVERAIRRKLANVQ